MKTVYNKEWFGDETIGRTARLLILAAVLTTIVVFGWGLYQDLIQ